METVRARPSLLCGWRQAALFHLSTAVALCACGRVEVLKGFQGSGGGASSTSSAGAGGGAAGRGAGSGVRAARSCPPLGSEPEPFFGKDYAVVDMFTRFAIGEHVIYLADGATGVVRSLPKHCNALPTILAEEMSGLADLAMSGEQISWATGSLEEDDEEVLRLWSVAGSELRNLVVTPVGEEPQHLALDETHAYWLADDSGLGALRRASLATGVVETLALLWDSTFFGGLALDESRVFFTDDVGVYEMPKTGGSPTLLGVSDEFWITALAIDDKFVYWTGGKVIWRAPKGGGPPTVVGKGLSTTLDIVPDGDYVYFYTLGGGQIRRFPKVGGTEAELVGHATQSTQKQLVVDGDALYWLDPGKGILFRMKKPP